MQVVHLPLTSPHLLPLPPPPASSKLQTVRCRLQLHFPLHFSPLTANCALFQRKLNTYIQHASQVPSVQWIGDFLRFIGAQTPHSSGRQYAEGFQFYN
jgi:hypothetical protein